MPTPNFSAGPTPPGVPTPTTGLDFWLDTTNGVLNYFFGAGVGPQGQGGWLPLGTPAITAALNASVVPTGRGQFAFVPAVVGTLGASLASFQNGVVAMCYDVVNNQINVVGSGGATIRRSAAFT